MKFPTGILGINARNLLYIRPFNKKKATQLADNKLQSKAFFQANNIPTAKVYAVIKNKKELESFRFSDIPAKSFVIKPNRGFGGQGIKIILDKTTVKKKKSEELKAHIADILDGNFSLTNAPDKAIIEQRIICHPTLAAFSYKGLPDIRVIVHNLIPVMAMLRLPTKESDGKANYHAGGAIAGIDLATGKITHAVIHGKYVTKLEENGQEIIGLQIPNWDQVLFTAAKAQLYSNIGYLAIDIVINKKEDPLVLEMNARGGLTIQIANKAKLRERLDRIKGLKVKTPERGVRIGKEIFGSHEAMQTLETEIERMSGKEILGSYEPIEITVGRKNYRTVALLDTTKIYTSLDKSAAIQLGIIDKNYRIREKPDFFTIILKLGKKRVRTFATIKDYSDHNYKIIVGRRNLRNIFIDPYKGLPGTYLGAPALLPSALDQERDADHLLSEIYRKVLFLNYLKPTNTSEEFEKWQKDHEYMPQFKYKNIPTTYDEILTDLESIPWFESDIGQLIKLRAQELTQQIQTIKLAGSKDFASQESALFRQLSKKELKLAEKYIKLEKGLVSERAIINATEISKFFKQIFQELDLKHWKIQIDEHNHFNNVAILTNYHIGIPKDRKVTRSRLLQLTAHEILTHALVRQNGEKQKWRIFAYGFPKYIYTQEGLAAYNEMLAAPEFKNNVLARSSQNALLSYYAQQETGTELMKRLLNLYSSKKAWRTFIRLKRGIGDTSKPGTLGRENVYFLGLLQFLDLKRIPKVYYCGRIDQEHIETAKRFNSLESFPMPKFPLHLDDK